MADLGTLGCKSSQAPFGTRNGLPLSSIQTTAATAVAKYKALSYLYMPFWTSSPGDLIASTSGNDEISGAVEESSVPIQYAVVRLYYRPTGVLIRTTRTDAAGLFTFDGLNTSDTQNYFVVAFDPEGGTQYNAIIFDRLTAV